jgi:hypothetical protein
MEFIGAITLTEEFCVGQKSRACFVERLVARNLPRRTTKYFSSVKFCTQEWINLWKASENFP